jgi:putative phosphoesterase
MKLLILSDIHANWPALEAVLAAEPDPDDVAFCGDVVDYGPQPVECLHWLTMHAKYSVRGNHDNALGLNVDCRCMGSFREYSVATRQWHRTLLSEDDCESLRRMPRLCVFEWGGRRFRMAHATPQAGLFEYLNIDQWEERVSELQEEFVLLGHTHIQGIRSFDRITVVNPGSVGLARDQPGKACYAVFRDGRMELKHIDYPVERTAALLRTAPLPYPVVDGLIGVLGGEVSAVKSKEVHDGA